MTECIITLSGEASNARGVALTGARSVLNMANCTSAAPRGVEVSGGARCELPQCELLRCEQIGVHMHTADVMLSDCLWENKRIGLCCISGTVTCDVCQVLHCLVGMQLGGTEGQRVKSSLRCKVTAPDVSIYGVCTDCTW